jgi:phospholipid/cholesterol/gamma-HCH transport system substrate-binding protein
MLRRTTKIQLTLFVLITLVGVLYVGGKYVGLTKGLTGGNPCTVSADFPDSGGIFTNAEVTYRGVTIGRVGKIDLIANGVRVKLNINNCDSPKIPASTSAIVADRSVVGEQYVNLVPENGSAPPYLRGGDDIPMQRNSIPIPPQTLLANLDDLVNSINTSTLQTTIDELGEAFNEKGPDLGKLLDAQNQLLQAAEQNLPATEELISSAEQVLQTQLDESPALSSFAHNLNLLSQQLKASNPDIESLLDNGPADFQVLDSFITDNQTDLGVLFANLATTGQLIVKHLPGLDEVFELYPALAAGAFTVLQNGVGRLGFVTNAGMPPDCGSPNVARQGYQGTVVRPPSDTSPQAPNTAAFCDVPAGSATDPRGSQTVPGGDPISTAGGGVAYPRVSTANTVRVGSTGGPTPPLGDKSWMSILTDGLN